MMFFCCACERWTEKTVCPICGDDCIPYPEKNTEEDPVNHPQHYTQGGIECIEAEKAALGDLFMGFLIGNTLKYLWRFRHKNGLEDLKKARWYLDKAIKEMEENNNG